MGLPKINIKFTEVGVSAIQRSGRGVVALILKDETATNQSYKRLDEVVKEDYTPENYQYLVQVFKGTPSKVIVKAEGTLAEQLVDLKNTRFNYLAMPDAEAEDKAELTAFIETSNSNDNKTFKAVLANEPADSEAVINFTTEGIVVGEEVYTASQYTARIAGILAGISLDRSATYFVLPEIEDIDAIEDDDEAVDNGELILINDGEKVKIGRAVNSLVTTTTAKGESFKKIKIVEGVQLMQDDIRNTFEDNFVGKYINDYDNKVLFITAINAYFKQLERDYILDRNADNTNTLDVEAQTLYIEGKGIATEELTEQQVKEYNTGSNVFVKANVKFVDAMEDLEFNVFI